MKKGFSIFLFVLLCLILSSENFANSSTSNKTTTVKFLFDGLGVLAFGDSTKASLGILDVIHHTPQIQIKTIENGREKSTQVINDREIKNKVISISVPAKHLQPTRYFCANMNKDTKDFRWCLDLESDLFQKQLYLKQDKLFSKIHFQTGTFFATNLTTEKYQFTAGSTLHSFNRQIGTPAASVTLHQGQVLNITGLAENIVLSYAANTSYEIAITNLPPPDMASMDHFAFYYDVLKTPVKKFMPAVVKKAAFSPRPLYCDIVILSKSNIN